MAPFSPFSRRVSVVFRVLRGIAISAHQICANLRPPLEVIKGILAVGGKEVELCTRGGLTNLKHHPKHLVSCGLSPSAHRLTTSSPCLRLIHWPRAPA